MFFRLRMGLRQIRLLVGYWLTKPIICTGCESKSPEMEPETRFQALRGAAGAKPPQCEKSRRGDPKCYS